MVLACAGLGAAIAPAAASASTYQMVIQTHADMGGKCVDVPFARFFAGMRLHTWDCNNINNGIAQVFAYDDQTQELKIGGLCMTSWGRGYPQDAVGIDTCHGGANQHWRMQAAGDYYQIIGINNQCLELRNEIKDSAAPLDLQDCDAKRAWRLWALVEAPSPGSSPPPVAQAPVAAPPARADASAAGCYTDNYTFSAVLSQSTTANSVSAGGAACLYSVAPIHPDQVQFTSASIEKSASNGSFAQTGDFAFKYQPNAGFKGTDEYAIKVCGHNNQQAGCAIVTYRVAVQ